MENKPIIEIKNLGTCFDGIWVHKDLNLTIYPNRIVSIIGPSGCGKTTLIREILMIQPVMILLLPVVLQLFRQNHRLMLI